MKRIVIFSKKHGRIVFTVDDCDFDRVLSYEWHYSKDKYSSTGYVIASIGGKITGLHRFITNAPPGTIVDHIDHDGLNNTRSNLRITDRSGNSRNRNKPHRNNKLGQRLIHESRTRTKYGECIRFVVTYNIENGKYPYHKSFVSLDDAIVFRDEILEKYYQFESNVEPQKA